MLFEVIHKLVPSFFRQSFAEHIHRMRRKRAVHAVAMEDNIHSYLLYGCFEDKNTYILLKSLYTVQIISVPVSLSLLYSWRSS